MTSDSEDSSSSSASCSEAEADVQRQITSVSTSSTSKSKKKKRKVESEKKHKKRESDRHESKSKSRDKKKESKRSKAASPSPADRDRERKNDTSKHRERDRERIESRSGSDRRSHGGARSRSRSPHDRYRYRSPPGRGRDKDRERYRDRYDRDRYADIPDDGRNCFSGRRSPPRRGRDRVMERILAEKREKERLATGQLPSYLTNAVLRNADEVQRRKQLWAKGRMAEQNEALQPSAAAAGSSRTDWSTMLAASSESDGKSMEKFKKLMGIKGEAGKNTEQLDEQRAKQHALLQGLDQQYTMARAHTHVQRGVGLGFGSAPQTLSSTPSGFVPASDTNQ